MYIVIFGSSIININRYSTFRRMQQQIMFSYNSCCKGEGKYINILYRMCDWKHLCERTWPANTQILYTDRALLWYNVHNALQWHTTSKSNILFVWESEDRWPKGKIFECTWNGQFSLYTLCEFIIKCEFTFAHSP